MSKYQFVNTSYLTHYPTHPSSNSTAGDLFRVRYGDYCGWTQSVLFCGELPQFKKVIFGDVEEVKKKVEKGGKEKVVKKAKIVKEEEKDREYNLSIITRCFRQQ